MSDGFEHDDDIGRPEIYTLLRDKYNIDAQTGSDILSLLQDRRWEALKDVARALAGEITETTMLPSGGKPLPHEEYCVEHGRVKGIYNLLDRVEAIAQEIKDHADSVEKG